LHSSLLLGILLHEKQLLTILLTTSAAMATTPPPLQGPTAKEKKYDRQLRLWAASGQTALEEAHLLLVNSGPGVIGVEVLKNLVLPGIGHFTILDDALVTEEDLGVNFFLEEDSLGRPRAAQTCKYLQELNPDVVGRFNTQVRGGRYGQVIVRVFTNFFNTVC